MRAEVFKHNLKEFKRKRYAFEVSLYTPVSEKDADILMDVIPNADTTDDTAIYNSLMERMAAMLTQKEFKIVCMRSEGYTNSEIAERYNVSHQSIQQTVEQIKNLVYSKLI